MTDQPPAEASAPADAPPSAAPASPPRLHTPAWAVRLPGLGVGALRVLVGAAAAAAVLTYLAIALNHLRYPFELEWIEGGMVDAVRRVAAGQRLYAKPTMDYVAFIYGPLWFYVAAAFAKVFGVGFFSARLVSVLSSIGVMALVARFVRREGGGLLPALLGAGLYAGTYSLACAFGDLARVDALSVLLLVAGLYARRFGASSRSQAAAGALFALAFFTKQSTLVAFVPVAVHAVFVDDKRGFVFSAVGSTLMIVGSAVLDFVHAHGAARHEPPARGAPPRPRPVRAPGLLRRGVRRGARGGVAGQAPPWRVAERDHARVRGARDPLRPRRRGGLRGGGAGPRAARAHGGVLPRARGGAARRRGV
jgi:hypothetical protein